MMKCRLMMKLPYNNGTFTNACDFIPSRNCCLMLIKWSYFWFGRNSWNFIWWKNHCSPGVTYTFSQLVTSIKNVAGLSIVIFTVPNCRLNKFLSLTCPKIAFEDDGREKKNEGSIIWIHQIFFFLLRY